MAKTTTPKGTIVAALLQKYDNFEGELTDAEIYTLREGMSFLFHFFQKEKLGPLTVYYGQKMEGFNRIIAARKESKKRKPLVWK